jgi:hypothetical protein
LKASLYKFQLNGKSEVLGPLSPGNSPQPRLSGVGI